MKHRESEQTQLRVSRLLNRDSVMLHAEMPSVQTALETPAATRTMAIKGLAKVTRVASSWMDISKAFRTGIPSITVAAVTIMAPVTMPPIIMGTLVPNRQSGSSSVLCQVRLAEAAWRNIL